MSAQGSRSPRSRGRGGALGSERLQALVGILISVAALTGCVWWALDQPAPEFPTSARSLALLGGALAVLACSMVVRGFRWSVIIRRAGIATGRVDPYALTVVGYMGNTVLPFRGGEALRIVLLKDNSDARWANAIGSIVPERVLDLFTVIMLLVVLFLAGVVEVPGGAAPVLIGCGLVVAIAGTAIVYRTLRRRGRLAVIGDRIRPLANASRLLLTPSGAWLALLSTTIWFFDGAMFFLVAEALGISVGLLEGTGLAVSAAAFSAIPAGPAFAGTYDAALLFGLGALAVPAGAALTFVLLVRFVAFVPVTIAGLAILIARYGGFSKLRQRVPTAAAGDERPEPEPATRPAG